MFTRDIEELRASTAKLHVSCIPAFAASAGLDVTAPSDAQPTNATYFANTPASYRGAGGVRFLYQGYWPTNRRLGRYVADHEPTSRAAEAAIR